MNVVFIEGFISNHINTATRIPAELNIMSEKLPVRVAVIKICRSSIKNP